MIAEEDGIVRRKERSGMGWTGLRLLGTTGDDISVPFSLGTVCNRLCSAGAVSEG